MSNWNFYPDSLVGVDLREDFHQFLYGCPGEPAKGRPAIIRKIRDTPCVCYDGKTGSSNSHCRYCQGEGFQFREELIDRIYIARSFGSVLGGATQIVNQNQLSTYGFTDPQRAVAYCEMKVFPDCERYVRGDSRIPHKLYELKVNDSGDAVHPVVRVVKWKIMSVTVHHSDLGAPVYSELGLSKENL